MYQAGLDFMICCNAGPIQDGTYLLVANHCYEDI